MFDSDSDSNVEKDVQLTINEHYAKAFEYKKEREELQKLKEKYGSDFEEEEGEETDSESEESEDEEGEELTPAVDAAILRTLARIKRKDPEIYNSGKDVFEEEKQKISSTTIKKSARKDKSKPVTLRQVALEEALNPDSRSPSPEPLTHVQEQEVLRKETIAAFRGVASGDESDDLLVPRSKTKDEIEQDEEEYRTFLEREVGPDLAGLVTVEAGVMAQEEEVDGRPEEMPGKKKKKKSKKSKVTAAQDKPKEEADQEFLMNYILNRGWIDRESKRVPTYGEITQSQSSRSKGKGKAAELNDSAGSASENGDDENNDLDEEEFEDIVDRFESSYNFRFEEPGAATIQTFPRTLESTVRREDTTRKDARTRKKERKEEELQKKREEIKRLKSLKMKEIRQKLERIGKEGGKDVDTTEALQELDLEGEWDPDAHDKQMAGIYGDGDDEWDAEKPHWDDDIDIGDIPLDDEPVASTSQKKKKKKKGKKKEDANDAADEGVPMDLMDADVEQDEEEWDGTEEMRKKKLDEYMDEIYGLEFNDLVGDLPTRFKYTPIQPEAFALTPAEILMATDAELNEFMSIKKYAPYRTGPKRWDNTRNEKLKELRRKIAERTGTKLEEEGARNRRTGGTGAGERAVKKRKGKKERMKMKGLADEQEDGEDIKATPLKEEGKRKRADDVAEMVEETKEKEKDIDAPAKKRRRKHKKETAVA
ncbi:Krr1-domain-containing protein [Pleurotus eryngii]|uniref:Krr1-domain-containing protein n=1 Tax=Pleurotus eryngii TaxID=5323 RepID=A0A9P6DEL4_PLEER|nr:Krr1-domain-containing protein [Pleurotus eryngii]